MNWIDKIIYTLAYWLRQYVDSTMLIKIALLVVFSGFVATLITGAIEFVVYALLFSVVLMLVLEFLYAKNSELEDAD